MVSEVTHARFRLCGRPDSGVPCVSFDLCAVCLVVETVHGAVVSGYTALLTCQRRACCSLDDGTPVCRMLCEYMLLF